MEPLPLSCRAGSGIQPVALMKLTQVEDPGDVLKGHSQKDILVEEKMDGWKAQVIKDGGKVRLFSRRGEEVTGNFPAIAKAMSGLPDGTLVEGELVYWDKGKQDVAKVTSLAGSSADKAVEKAKSLPGKMKLHLYDILWLKGRSVSGEPFSKRRELLEKTVKTSDTVQLTRQYPYAEWKKAMDKAVGSGGEGIVLKSKSAKYQYKPKGETEPKPKDTMWKYKGGAGKHDSDDYVVYGTAKSKTGKLMAQFGQYHKGRLYAISEIDNFSAEDEAGIEKRLRKGPFVIEIGFQERVPGGLRHQKFLRFRDDKKPKDAAMHEFHVEHIDEFEPARMERKAMFALAGGPDPAEVATVLERAVGAKPMPVGAALPQIGAVGNVDGDKIFRIMARLESGGRTDTVGDAGTSFGLTQVHAPYLLSRLSKMPGAEAATGMASDEMRRLSTAWLDMLGKLRKARIWKTVPVDQAMAGGLANSAVVRKEKTFIRRPDMVIEKHGGEWVGKAVDEDALRAIGFDTGSEAFRRVLARMYGEYITDNVALSSLIPAWLAQAHPAEFLKYQRSFNAANIKKNPAMASILDKASAADFAGRIKAVVDMVQRYGYDATAPGAFNIYQLIVIANASGTGAVQRFLQGRKPFFAGNLHYLQSSRFRKTLADMRRTQPDLAGVIDQLLAGLPPNDGMAGFAKTSSLNFEPVSRKERILVLSARNPMGQEPMEETAGKVLRLIERRLNEESISSTDLRDASLTMMRIDEDGPEPVLLLWTTSDAKRLGKWLPRRIWGMPVVVHQHETPMGFEDEPTVIEPVARMDPLFFGQFKRYLAAVRHALKEKGLQMSERKLREKVIGALALERGLPEEQIRRMLGENGRFAFGVAMIGKYASASGVLAFPGQYAEDIKSGRMERTIRPGDMPVEPEEVVDAISYSGGHICRIKILAKEIMSLLRIAKAFGKHVARSLEHRFGPNRRFVVIRFCRFGGQDADDGKPDEKKRGEVLIDKDGVKLTRGQIRDHYAKPAVRRQIMSRIKGKPVLIYLGVGTNEKILKRNHNGKQIVIGSDDEKGKDSPGNYWYWVDRRLLAIHEVFGTKTDIGFVDLDLHGGYPLEKAKEYARKAAAAIKEKYGIAPKIYQSGGTGLHVEFKLGKEVGIDGLRKELRELLDKLNEDFEGATTGVVKGKGMRTDVSTLHNKGSLRVPGSLGETWGKVKKPLSQDVEDSYGNNDFGTKHSDNDTGPFGDGGAITPMPYESMAPSQPGAATASDRRALFRAAAED
jgi:hypothetical protein